MQRITTLDYYFTSTHHIYGPFTAQLSSTVSYRRLGRWFFPLFRRFFHSRRSLRHRTVQDTIRLWISCFFFDNRRLSLDYLRGLALWIWQGGFSLLSDNGFLFSFFFLTVNGDFPILVAVFGQRNGVFSEHGGWLPVWWKSKIWRGEEGCDVMFAYWAEGLHSDEPT